MSDNLKLMAIIAHPDDESLGFGGALSKYAAEGIETYLITATKGERGWMGDEREHPGFEALGKTREAELRAAAEVLAIRNVDFLCYLDGDLDQTHPAEIVAKISGHLRRVKPDVVVTFGTDGAYGHPDHIAISQFTTAAIIEAANPNSLYHRDMTPHSVSKLYYLMQTKELLSLYQSIFGDLVMHIDGVDRRGSGWPDWMITTRINAEEYQQIVLRAFLCHQSQLPAYSRLEQLSDEKLKVLWGIQTFYRVFSLVNGGRKIESDLFEGLR